MTRARDDSSDVENLFRQSTRRAGFQRISHKHPREIRTYTACAYK